jgi:hypothetical protein
MNMQAQQISEGVYRIDGTIVAVNPATVAVMSGQELDAYLRSVIHEARGGE